MSCPLFSLSDLQGACGRLACPPRPPTPPPPCDRKKCDGDGKYVPEEWPCTPAAPSGGVAGLRTFALEPNTVESYAVSQMSTAAVGLVSASGVLVNSVRAGEALLLGRVADFQPPSFLLTAASRLSPTASRAGDLKFTRDGRLFLLASQALPAGTAIGWIVQRLQCDCGGSPGADQTGHGQMALPAARRSKRGSSTRLRVAQQSACEAAIALVAPTFVISDAFSPEVDEAAGGLVPSGPTRPPDGTTTTFSVSGFTNTSTAVIPAGTDVLDLGVVLPSTVKFSGGLSVIGAGNLATALQLNPDNRRIVETARNSIGGLSGYALSLSFTLSC